MKQFKSLSKKTIIRITVGFITLPTVITLSILSAKFNQNEKITNFSCYIFNEKGDNIASAEHTVWDKDRTIETELKFMSDWTVNNDTNNQQIDMVFYLDTNSTTGLTKMIIDNNQYKIMSKFEWGPKENLKPIIDIKNKNIQYETFNILNIYV